MRKYIFIFKSEIMSSLQYSFNIFASFIGYFIHIFIFLNLWKYIYENPEEIISGYTMNQMIWYIIVTEYLWSILGGRSLCRKISEDVKSGNISYNINKPYSYIGYALSSHLGSIVIKSFLYLILGLITGFILIGSIPNIDIIKAIFVLISCIIATVISTLITIFIGLFSFYIEDSSPFYWIYTKFILIIGTIFPIEFFPEIIRPLIKLSPIYAAVYGPAKLFVEFSWDKFITVTLSQILYILISYSLCNMIYKKGVKKLNVNGG